MLAPVISFNPVVSRRSGREREKQAGWILVEMIVREAKMIVREVSSS